MYAPARTEWGWRWDRDMPVTSTWLELTTERELGNVCSGQDGVGMAMGRGHALNEHLAGYLISYRDIDIQATAVFRVVNSPLNMFLGKLQLPKWRIL